MTKLLDEMCGREVRGAHTVAEVEGDRRLRNLYRSMGGTLAQPLIAAQGGVRV